VYNCKYKEKYEVKNMKIKIQPKQHYQAKMTSEELQAHLQMKRSGASKTKNGKAYQRRPKHRNAA
jgi:hypothetical protein